MTIGKKKKDSKTYMAEVDYDTQDANKHIPARVQFDQPFTSIVIYAVSGPSGQIQTLHIEEIDKNGNRCR